MCVFCRLKSLARSLAESHTISLAIGGEERAEAAGVSEHSIRSSRSDGQDSTSPLEEHDNSRSSSSYVRSITIKAPSTKPALRKRKRKNLLRMQTKERILRSTSSPLSLSLSLNLCVSVFMVLLWGVICRFGI